MLRANVMPLAEALGPWHDFYALVGAASATMVGLLFVAASVGSGVFKADRPAPLRVFLSASVVNFSSVLAACMIALAPTGSWLVFGVLIAACGLSGLAHTCIACRDTVLDGLLASLDLEDRIWYLMMPLAGYLFETGSGAALALRWEQGCVALSLSMGTLLAVGIHNAWDITVWSMTRRSQ